jgi:5'-deoxynucleotidase YfbR-like HD superfamily hydrolase
MPTRKSAPKIQKIEAPRAWQRMLSGRRLDLLNPSPLDIEIEDIAHGLARVARWNGQTHGDHAFSVAQHSVLVWDFCCQLRSKPDPRMQMAALLHDAPEYVVGDLISPFKAAVGLDYKVFENRLMSAIHIRYGLPPEMPDNIKALIKKADRLSAYYEAVNLAGFSAPEAARIFGAPKGVTVPDMSPLPIPEAQEQFMERFEDVNKRLK